jgi:hypothetical protein
MNSHVHDTRARGFLKQLNLAKKKYKGPGSRDQHKCMTLIATALIVGTDEVALQKSTGYPVTYIKTVSRRMYSGLLWKGEKSELDERGKTQRDFMRVIFAHASVARGATIREIRGRVVRYFDLVDQETADEFPQFMDRCN